MYINLKTAVLSHNHLNLSKLDYADFLKENISLTLCFSGKLLALLLHGQRKIPYHFAVLFFPFVYIVR